jgi:hypothetical protein
VQRFQISAPRQANRLELDLVGRRGGEALHVGQALIAPRRREAGDAEHDVDAEVSERGEIRLLGHPALVRRPPSGLVVDRGAGDGYGDGGARPDGPAGDAAAGREVREGLRRVAPGQRERGPGDGGGV